VARKVQLTIDQGATFTKSFTFLDTNSDPIDFTTHTANSQLRKTFTSTTAHNFTVGLFGNGQITLSMSANTTGVIDAGRYVYDLEVQSTDGTRSRLVEGIATITPQVTR
jgi:hypothetical protein